MVAKFKSGDFHIINGVLQTAHSLFKRCVFHVHTMYLNMQSSVLTRILPWGVPGPPLLRNRGPVRTLGGQSYKKHAVRRTWARTPNCLLHEVPTWSNMAEEVFTIRRRSLRCSGTCVGPMKVKATKLKTLTHLISCFFIYSDKQNALVLGWPLKLLKSVWLVACPCALTGASSWF